MSASQNENDVLRARVLYLEEELNIQTLKIQQLRTEAAMLEAKEVLDVGEGDDWLMSYYEPDDKMLVTDKDFSEAIRGILNGGPNGLSYDVSFNADFLESSYSKNDKGKQNTLDDVDMALTSTGPNFGSLSIVNDVENIKILQTTLSFLSASSKIGNDDDPVAFSSSPQVVAVDHDQTNAERNIIKLTAAVKAGLDGLMEIAKLGESLMTGGEHLRFSCEDDPLMNYQDEKTIEITENIPYAILYF
ncbi:hypothetical protein BJ875DRAFT_446007 [Amylocarpus encephaloides]|uniref:Uncharacterized protein n=1 Tax=Amylocarpus encephaloides TaxID=45428 RepID=A0A9P7Y939_9HELO|nr:hypothetical protein BJ875DRAFT_446007 [Amylocarpus encephaloides]